MNKLVAFFLLILFSTSSIVASANTISNREYDVIHTSISQINRKLFDLESEINFLSESVVNKDNNYSLTSEDLSRISDKNKNELNLLEKRINQLIKLKINDFDRKYSEVFKKLENRQDEIKKQLEEINSILEERIINEKKRYAELLSRIKANETTLINQSNVIKSINSQIEKNHQNIKIRTESLESTFSKKNEMLGEKVEKTKEDSVWTRNIEYALGIIIILLVIIFVLYRSGSKKVILGLNKKISIVESESNNKLTEVDMKLAELLESKLKENAITTEGSVDHGLVLKISDEIARMETNLNKMDKSVKGYKQLVKAIERIKKSAEENGYEIINLIGHEYNDGMQCEAQFVNDEEIPEGKSIITGMLRMQVNYQGHMIQSPKIIVSQNI